jgi:uncharacterized C2H2 Zn-finger protein
MVCFQPTHGPLRKMRVVTSYRHVGTKMVGAETMLPEVRVRMASMSEAARPFVSKVFRCTSVPVQKRMMVMKALLFSRGFFQCSVWPLLNANEAEALHSSTMRIVRHLVAEPVYDRNHHRSDEEVLKITGAAAPVNMLRHARLSFFVRCIRLPDPATLKLLVAGRMAKRSWLRAVEDDLAVLSLRSPLFASLRGQAISAWVGVIRTSPKLFLKSLQKAMCSDAMNAKDVWATTSRLRQVDMCITCPSCEKQFKDGHALQVHKMRVHGWLHEARRMLDSSFCTVCLKEFHSRTRVLAHVMAKSAVCRMNLALRPFRLSPEHAAMLDSDARVIDRVDTKSGWRRGTAHLACVQLAGPLLPVLPLVADTRIRRR